MTMTITSSLPIGVLAEVQKQEFQAQPGWHGTISVQEAEALLKGRKAYTYVLSAEQEDNVYRLSWVTEEGPIAHLPFWLKQDAITGIPYYKNCSSTSFRSGIMAERGEIHILISRMMNCHEEAISPFMRS